MWARARERNNKIKRKTSKTLKEIIIIIIHWAVSKMKKRWMNIIPNTDRKLGSVLLNLQEQGHLRATAEPDVCTKKNQNQFTRVPYPQLFGTMTHSLLSQNNITK